MDKEEMQGLFDDATEGLKLTNAQTNTLYDLISDCPVRIYEDDIDMLASIITQAKETPLPPRMMGEWEITSSFHIGDKEIVFGETDTPTPETYNCTYMVATCGFDNPFSAAWPEKGKMHGFTSYIEAVASFGESVQAQLDVVKAEREQRGNNPPLTYEDCIPGSEKMNYTNQVVVYSPDALAEENRFADNQVYLARSGNGCDYNAYHGRAVFSTNLYTGEELRLNRPHILGIIQPEKMPEWANEKLEALGIKPSLHTQLEAGKQKIAAEQPKSTDAPPNKGQPEI